MDKGARVTITGGRNGKGVSGEVFWKGANKWGSGERLGVRGEDGETYWVSDEDVELASGPAPKVEAGPTFSKGDRVMFKQRGEEGTGSVFWIGESRNGPGQRLGIRNDADPDNAVWLDARFAKPLEGEAPPAGGAPPAVLHDDGDSEEPWSPPVNMDEVPGPPIDDAYVDYGSDEDGGAWSDDIF